VKRAVLDALLRARRAKRRAALATDLDSGEQWLLEPRADLRTGMTQIGDRVVFANVFELRLRMIVIGAVHIAQPLVRAAQLAGFEVSVIDPRHAFAAHARFPGVAITTQWPDEALAQIAPDARSAIVALTHDPKLDDPALAFALRSEAFYVGALGSRKTHAKRIERLRERGFSSEEIARIRGPVGLAIGAKTPAEIAISILAEVIQQLRQPS
jgi:xanthine dehydrogenase accessory factor